MQQITINTIKDVQDFCQFLYDEYDLAFHPDDPFDQYINAQGLDLFTKEEADYLDSVMQKCFDVCEQANTNVYDVMEPIQQKEFKKRKIFR
ncbi:MAG: hypothetical protein WC756_06775 [Taibaiella sp.]|jgi:hypothetical protein